MPDRQRREDVHTRSNRFTLLLLACCLLHGGAAKGQMGPPQTRAAALDYTLGVGLHNAQSEWKPYEYVIARNRVYVEGSFGLSDDLEIFGRVGGSECTINDVNTYRDDLTRDVSSLGYPAFCSGGVRGLGWHFGRFSIGASAEVAWYSSIEKNIRWDYDVYQELYFDAMVEFNLGLPIGCEVGNSILYGGPLIHFAYTVADIRTHTFGPDWDVDDEVDELTVRDKAGRGAFLGCRTPLGQNGWHLQLEGAAMRKGFNGAIGFYKAR